MTKLIFTITIYYVICSFSGYLYSCDEYEVDNIKIVTDSIDNSIYKCTQIEKKSDTRESLTAHYLDDNLVKITVVGSQKGNSENYELYFKDGLIIYVHESEKKQLSDGTKKESNYYYFKDNMMICWQKNDLTYANEDEIFYSKEKNLLVKVDYYLTQIQ